MTLRCAAISCSNNKLQLWKKKEKKESKNKLYWIVKVGEGQQQATEPREA